MSLEESIDGIFANPRRFDQARCATPVSRVPGGAADDELTMDDPYASGEDDDPTEVHLVDEELLAVISQGTAHSVAATSSALPAPRELPLDIPPPPTAGHQAPPTPPTAALPPSIDLTTALQRSAGAIPQSDSETFEINAVNCEFVEVPERWKTCTFFFKQAIDIGDGSVVKAFAEKIGATALCYPRFGIVIFTREDNVKGSFSQAQDLRLAIVRNVKLTNNKFYARFSDK